MEEIHAFLVPLALSYQPAIKMSSILVGQCTMHCHLIIAMEGSSEGHQNAAVLRQAKHV